MRYLRRRARLALLRAGDLRALRPPCRSRAVALGLGERRDRARAADGAPRRAAEISEPTARPDSRRAHSAPGARLHARAPRRRRRGWLALARSRATRQHFKQ